MLQAVEKRVIPNGVDLEVFQPNEDRVTARKALNLPAEGFIGLYVAVSGSGNPFKDYSTIQKTISNLTQPRNEPVYFVVLGGDCEKMEERDGFQYYFRPFQPDARKVALYYRAADVFLHATKADNFPTVILEALACGTPVVATAVGGIPEQIRDGETGFLVPAGDAQAMADKLQYLMSEPALLQQMGARAAADARQRFGLERQAAAYLSWYEEIIEGWKKQHASH